MSRAWSVPDLDPAAPLVDNARRIVAVRIAELFSYAPVIPDAGAVKELHDARIAAKRLRYSLELFRSILGDDGERAIEQLKTLQEDLGNLHDQDVRIALIEDELNSLAGDSGGETGDPKPGLQALLERERAARAKRHRALVKRWQRLERNGFRAKLVRLTTVPLPA